jgi:hypothetical protein
LGVYEYIAYREQKVVSVFVHLPRENRLKCRIIVDFVITNAGSETVEQLENDPILFVIHGSFLNKSFNSIYP